jgi:hypothetical protein
MSKQQEREWLRGEAYISWKIGPFEVRLCGDNDTEAVISVSLGYGKSLCHETLAVPITVQQAKKRSGYLILGWLDETREKVEFFRHKANDTSGIGIRLKKVTTEHDEDDEDG